MIELNNIQWRREGKTILKGINWRVQQGEHWCLLGLNGSGKTTLLNMINGYIWPTSGSVQVLGKRFGEVDLRELRKSIGWVSTSLQAQLHASERARNVVLSGKFASIGVYEETDTTDEEEAQHLLDVLGCSELADRTYGTLSQGEKQRVLIARALMAKPRLLILDEPCTGLDVFAREQLLQRIAGVAAGPNAPTLLYVTHHVEEILPCFAHSLLIKKGEVYAAGKTEELLTSQCMSEFWGVPVELGKNAGRYWLTVQSQAELFY